MTIVGLIMAGLSLAFGALAIRDVRAGNAGLVFMTLRKWKHPLPFWGLVTLEASAALLCALSALGAFLVPATCDELGRCTVTIQAETPAP